MLIVSLCDLEDYSVLWKDKGVDLLEIRLDLLSESDLESLKTFTPNLPFILTFKKTSDLDALSSYSHLNPTYIDLDFILFNTLYPRLQKIFPKAKFLVSRHTSKPYLVERFFKLYPRADLHKLVIETENSHLALKLARRAQKEKKILFASGIQTAFSRFFSAWHYTYVKKPTGVGQYSIHEILTIYRALKPLKHFYALIGKNVDSSPSHLTHNRFFAKTMPDLCYLKIPIQESKLLECLNLLKQIGCLGLSITTPFKEKLPRYFFPTYKHPQTINTLDFQTKRVINTDAKALIDFLKPQNGQSVLILGSGDCANHFIDVLKVFDLNLSQWSRKEGFVSHSPSVSIKTSYDVIVNATSSPDPLNPLPPCRLLINLYHHIKAPEIETRAQKDGALICRGFDFFMSQAFHQFLFWNPKLSISEQNLFFSLGKEAVLEVE